MMKPWENDHLEQLRREQSPKTVPDEQPQIQIPLWEPTLEDANPAGKQQGDTKRGVVVYQM